ncbi:GGDEF: diguanylate cyclase (GGDEF) domain [Rubrobacter radiotolerans]|uniref:EAL domain-containing protein n=1 Tax=Rubrobacter radiotolerans TaxID=42256 RepID=A0A023WYX5_RUBRA|nr:EAL domain-containing protein [Rubrobacter radiotolerans]AHY45427.1 GGDEF: diguanylate cyclase (GGDEF) domain [Rubrobacter radiotolerans]MDX5892838.1 EAL domain-containing protein [Rubrobacter radiotolerans]SMC02597.1 diguanylate cyclase (GGDEF) domain-containing protein [Rubrobacter radiotolerans DSM 5868]
MHNLEAQAHHLGQLLNVLFTAGMCFSGFFALIYVLANETSIGIVSLIVLAFSGLSLVARRCLKTGLHQQSVLIVCSAILAASLGVLILEPTMFPAVAVTPLVCVGVALPYANEPVLKGLIMAAWVATGIAAVTGAWMLAHLPDNPLSLLDVAAIATTLVTAAALLLLVLWQFRSRLLTSLKQARAAEERLSHEVKHDSLTGLPNRSMLTECLREALREGSEGSHALLFLDVDRFKHVNDSMGHDTGDELLRAVAERILLCVRERDLVARMGGDEFVILLKDVRPGDAETLARRIKDSLGAPVRLHGSEFYVTVSVGIVPDLARYRDPQGPIRDADTAMYRAKGSGKSRFVVFDEEMRKSAVSLLKLENDLRRAVEREEFTVHYQPVVWLASGGVSGFEALARWEHPERGLLGPDAFMRLAEETGLVHEIDRFVLAAACRQVALWREVHRETFPPAISVNLSPTGLLRPDLVPEVANVLAETGLPGYALVLELTERAVMEDAEASLDALHRLRGLGVRVHVDDFGTGYSSLQLLHRLPVDALKIDRSFISGEAASAGVTGESAEIVQTILTMAHALGMEVVAEGVETDEQLDALREMGCDFVQGRRFSEPVPKEKAASILAAEPVW